MHRRESRTVVPTPGLTDWVRNIPINQVFLLLQIMKAWGGGGGVLESRGEVTDGTTICNTNRTPVIFVVSLERGSQTETIAIGS